MGTQHFQKDEIPNNMINLDMFFVYKESKTAFPTFNQQTTFLL